MKDETIKKLTERPGVTEWKRYGHHRYYINGSHYVKSAKAFFAEDWQRAKCHWLVPGGFIHGDRSYNGAVKEELKGYGFPDLVYVDAKPSGGEAK